MAETIHQAEKSKNFSSEPVGYLLGRPGLVVMLVSLVFAAWFGQTTVAMMLGLLLGAAGLSRLWSRYCLSGVSCQRTLDQTRVFPGEKITLKTRLVNRKPLPLPWIQVDDEVPLAFSREAHAGPESRPGFGFLSKSSAMLWYSAMSWRQELACEKRGYYRLGPVSVTSGDIFGFYPRTMREPQVEHVIVYPRIFPVTRLALPSVYPLGDSRSERRIFEDPTRNIGIRDYQPEDSLKRIHWKGSARHQRLLSRVYEPTTTLRVALFLAVESFPHHLTAGEAQFELGISTAASIASHLAETNSPVGLFANARLADSAEAAAIPPGSGIGHLIAVLEAMAKLTSSVTAPFEDFLRSQRGRLPWGTTLVFILAQPTLTLGGLLAELKAHGHKVLVIQVGEGARPGSDTGIEWHNVASVLQMPASTGGPSAA